MTFVKEGVILIGTFGTTRCVWYDKGSVRGGNRGVAYDAGVMILPKGIKEIFLSAVNIIARKQIKDCND